MLHMTIDYKQVRSSVYLFNGKPVYKIKKIQEYKQIDIHVGFVNA